MTSFRFPALLAASIGLAIASPALARPALVSSAPAASTTVGNVKTVTLSFSEELVPAQSGLEVIMTGMPGMEGHHPPMRMGGVKVSVSADRKSLVATMTRALPMGSYVVNWHVAGSDAVRVTGKMSFSAR